MTDCVDSQRGLLCWSGVGSTTVLVILWIVCMVMSMRKKARITTTTQNYGTLPDTLTDPTRCSTPESPESVVLTIRSDDGNL